MNALAQILQTETIPNAKPFIRLVKHTTPRNPNYPQVFKKLKADGYPEIAPPYLMMAAGLNPLVGRCKTGEALKQIHKIRYCRGVN